MKLNDPSDFIGEIDAWIADEREVARRVTRGLSIVLFHHLVSKTPQFSGDAAANWKYHYNSPVVDFEPGIVFPKKRYWMGASPAIEKALSLNYGAGSGHVLGDHIFITNTAKHREFYSWLIEENQVNFRPVNKGAVARRSMQEMGVYMHVLKDSDIEFLMEVRMGMMA